MSKMGSHDPFEHLKHILSPKEGSRLLTTKSQELPRFPCVQVAWNNCLKALNEGHNFDLYLTSIGGLHVKLWGPKVARITIVGISGLPLGSRGSKCHLDVGLMKNHKVYYKGEGGGFPQVQVVLSLVSPSLPVARPNMKSVPTMH